MTPDHLRAAIERIGIEKDSDYTLVMEEVGRMEAEEKLVERVARSLDGVFPSGSDILNLVYEDDPDGFNELARAAIEASGLLHLLSAAEAVLAAGIVNPTGSMKVANAMDALVKAVREVKG